MPRPIRAQAPHHPRRTVRGNAEGADVADADYETTIHEPLGASSTGRDARTGDPRRTVEVSPDLVAPSHEGTAQVFRPANRPPLALLTALDDGCVDTGETWRIRTARFIIGRTSGDCVIAHDADISGEHAEIVRVEEGDGFAWTLKDLTSTNGTFIRVRRTVLRDGRELLMGARRYAFRSASNGKSGADARRANPAG